MASEISDENFRRRKLPKSGFKILLILLNLLLLTMSQQLTADSEDSIKVTAFNVPNIARIGDRVRLACNYTLSPGQMLHTMKLFKDDKEMYRVVPIEGGGRGEYKKLSFSVEGVELDLDRSSNYEAILVKVNKLTAGNYKCQVTVENSFKSLSVSKRMEVREKLGKEVMAMGIVGNGNYQGSNSQSNAALSWQQQQQQQQRQANNRRIQQRQQQFQSKQANQLSSTSQAHELHKQSSSSSPSFLQLETRQPKKLLLLLVSLMVGTIIIIRRDLSTSCYKV